MVYGVNDMAYIVPRRDPRTQSSGVVAGYAQTAQRWPAEPLARRRHGLSELTGPEAFSGRSRRPILPDTAQSGRSAS